MADYYTRFSFVMSLPNQEALDYALRTAAEARSIFGGSPVLSSFPKELIPATEEWTFESEAQSGTTTELWLHGDDGGIDSVCLFLRHLLKKFQPTGQVAFQWADDCSQQRVDAYGGGAAIVTAKRIKTMSTRQWVHKHRPKHESLHHD